MTSHVDTRPPTEIVVTVDQAIDELRKTLRDYDRNVQERVKELKKSGSFRTLPKSEKKGA